MTLSEFKIWMEGFSEGKDFDKDGVTAEQWQRINAKFSLLEETKPTSYGVRTQEVATPKPRGNPFEAIKADNGFS